MAEQEENNNNMGIEAEGVMMGMELVSQLLGFLQMSQTNTDKAVLKLDSIRGRLNALEIALRPTQDRIQPFRTTYENADKTLKCMEAILALRQQYREVMSPPLTGTDTPPIYPPDEFDDAIKLFRANNFIVPSDGRVISDTSSSGPNTIEGWLKEMKAKSENKEEENRIYYAELLAAVFAVAVAFSVASNMAETAASSAQSNDEKMAMTDMAVASAAIFVAARCAETAEAMGAERDCLVSLISYAENFRSCDNIKTLTVAADTALRRAATLKGSELEEEWIATTLEGSIGTGICNEGSSSTSGTPGSGNISLELLEKGNVPLLKRTRKGCLHWKIVSVYIKKDQVMLKMRSKYMGGIYTNTKKYVVVGVCPNLPAWPGNGGEEKRYFGLKTRSSRGTVEFECRNQSDHNIWIDWVSGLLSMAESQNRN